MFKYIIYCIKNVRHQLQFSLVNLVCKIFFLLQEYSVQVTFREQWNDERLGYIDNTDGKYITIRLIFHIIYPNSLTFFLLFVLC